MDGYDELGIPCSELEDGYQTCVSEHISCCLLKVSIQHESIEYCCTVVIILLLKFPKLLSLHSFSTVSTELSS